MKTITVYPTNKLRESGAIVPLGTGINIQPDEFGAIEVPIKHVSVENTINHFVKTGKLSLTDPDIRTLTKKELIAKAEELGLEWTDKEKRMKNDDMEEALAMREAEIAEQVVEPNEELIAKASELGLEWEVDGKKIEDAEMEELVKAKEDELVNKEEE